MLFDLFVNNGSKTIFFGTYSFDDCVSILLKNRETFEKLLFSVSISLHIDK